VVMLGGNDDRDGVDLIDQLRVIEETLGVALAGDLLGLCSIQIADGDKIGPGVLRVDSGMVLTQVPNPHNPDPDEVDRGA